MKTLNRIQLRLTVIFLFTTLLFASPTLANQLRIYHIDVEQADATLIVSPSGKSLLIDSGKNGHGPRLLQAMKDAGIERIDHHLCTHYHEDHYGGIDDLVNSGVEVINAYDRGDKDYIPAKKRNGKTHKDYEDAVGHRAEQLTRGETIEFDPEVSVKCIATGGVVIGEEDPEHGEDENDVSIALSIEYGDFKYFIGGDIEAPTEQKIADRDLVMDVDVYQANHHGSHSSSSLDFMNDLKPSVIVISNGNHGRFHHPRQVTLDTYASLEPKPVTFQTNKYLKGDERGGNVPDEYIADPESTEEDGTILVTVDKSKGSYQVTYPGHSHSFEIK